MEFENRILHGDCREVLKKIPDNSLAGCITDPPYNYEFVGHKWSNEEIIRRTERVQREDSKTLIKHIPYGSGLAGGVRNERWYKKNRDNIVEYQEWTEEWGKEVYRTLKPGAYIFVFNSTRTVAHIQVALENVGFYARDIIVWRKNSGIPKGLNVAKKLEKLGDENASLWEGWHSCLRNEWEAIVVLQKPLEDNYINTLKNYDVSLLHAKVDGKFKSNIIQGVKREANESFNSHVTVKPLKLIIELIEMSIPKFESNIVLDPFLGSGTTAVASKKLGIKYIGIEVEEKYIEIANQRLEEIDDLEQVSFLDN